MRLECEIFTPDFSEGRDGIGKNKMAEKGIDVEMSYYRELEVDFGDDNSVTFNVDLPTYNAAKRGDVETIQRLRESYADFEKSCLETKTPEPTKVQQIRKGA